MKTEQIRIVITPELKKLFKNQCKNDGKDMSKIIVNLIEDYVEGEIKKEYEWMKKVINNLPKEKIVSNDGNEIEVIRLKNDLTVKLREKDSDSLNLLMTIG